MAKIKQAKAFIESARRAATFESASFHPDRNINLNRDEFTEAVRQATKRYRETWILPYLDLAMDILDGKKVDWTPRG